MADHTIAPEKVQKKKKKNFTDGEMEVIQTEVERNYQILTEKLNNNTTNAKKQKIWQGICHRVNSLGVDIRTPKDIKDKWANTKKEAKKAFAEQTKSLNKTGGGPPPQKLSLSVSRTIDLCKDSAAFKGLGGVESEIHQDNALTAEETDASLPYEDASQELFTTCTPEMQLSPESPSLLRADPIMSSAILSRPVEPRQSTSELIPVSRKEKKTPKRKAGTTDVQEVQRQYLLGEIDLQAKRHQIMDLQIKVLEKILNNDEVPPISLSQLWGSLSK